VVNYTCLFSFWAFESSGCEHCFDVSEVEVGPEYGGSMSLVNVGNARYIELGEEET
jgi:hypothetical protein